MGNIKLRDPHIAPAAAGCLLYPRHAVVAALLLLLLLLLLDEAEIVGRIVLLSVVPSTLLHSTIYSALFPSIQSGCSDLILHLVCILMSAVLTPPPTPICNDSHMYSVHATSVHVSSGSAAQSKPQDAPRMSR